MVFDAAAHRERLILIQRAKRLFPGEKNISVLLQRMAELEGKTIKAISTKDANHSPTPEETGPFGKCPKCGERKLSFRGLCGGCKDAEGGKYKTKLKCLACGFEEKRPQFTVQCYKEFGVEIKGFVSKHIIKDKGK